MSASAFRALKIAVFGLCLLPLTILVLQTFGVGGLSLGANPIEELIHSLGTVSYTHLTLPTMQ